MQRIRKTFRKKQTKLEKEKETLQATRSLPPNISRTSEESLASNTDFLGNNKDTKQIRSISCDELLIKETEASNLVEMAAKEAKPDNALDVPSNKNYRSKSLDSQAVVSRNSGTFLEIPKWKLLIRKSSASSTSSSSTDSLYFKDCVHCLLIEEYLRSTKTLPASILSSMSCEIPLKMQLTLEEEEVVTAVVKQANESDKDDNESISSNSQEDVNRPERTVPSGDSVPTFTFSLPPEPNIETQFEDLGSGITVISLEVPVMPKQGRSASVDSSFLQVPNRTDIAGELPPSKSQRSRSVDIALPVGPDGPYLIVPQHDSTQLTTQ